MKFTYTAEEGFAILTRVVIFHFLVTKLLEIIKKPRSRKGTAETITIRKLNLIFGKPCMHDNCWYSLWYCFGAMRTSLPKSIFNAGLYRRHAGTSAVRWRIWKAGWYNIASHLWLNLDISFMWLCKPYRETLVPNEKHPTDKVERSAFNGYNLWTLLSKSIQL